MKNGTYIVQRTQRSLLEIDDMLTELDFDKIADITVNVFVRESPEDWRLVKHSKVIGYWIEGADKAISVRIDNLFHVLK
jgi:phosphoglycerate dehydrogenase-like enzyme